MKRNSYSFSIHAVYEVWLLHLPTAFAESAMILCLPPYQLQSFQAHSFGTSVFQFPRYPSLKKREINKKEESAAQKIQVHRFKVNLENG